MRSNMPVERPAGSRALAAAAHWRRPLDAKVDQLTRREGLESLKQGGYQQPGKRSGQ